MYQSQFEEASPRSVWRPSKHVSTNETEQETAKNTDWTSHALKKNGIRKKDFWDVEELVRQQNAGKNTNKANAGMSVQKAPSLGYGAGHAYHFGYLDGGKLRGIDEGRDQPQPASSNYSSSSSSSSSSSTSSASSSEARKTGNEIINPQKNKCTWNDPEVMATPQALGYGRRFRHYFAYLAPHSIPTETNPDKPFFDTQRARDTYARFG